MSDDLLPLRVQYLEKTVNKLIANTMTQVKNHKKTTASAGDTSPVTAEARTGEAISLINPAYRIPYQGNLVRVTAETLETQPEILQYMREHHPTCFKPAPASPTE